MYVPRFPNFLDKIRLLSLRHGLAALALAFSLAAGLACDESTLTETRAPIIAPQGELSDDPGAVPFDGGTLSAIGLPVNQSVATTAPAPAFRIRQTGSGPNGIIQVSNTSNTQPALQGLTNGLGRAGFFRVTNTANNQPALLAQTNGSEFSVGVKAVMFGTGPAATFQVSNTSNRRHGVEIVTNGSEPGSGALYVERSGQSGRAGIFMLNDVNNSSTALFVSTEGTGLGLDVRGGTLLSGDVQVNDDLQVDSDVHVDGNSIMEGNLFVNGTLSKSAGSFKIDHPLDPERKSLSHSFVESPDMMNVYNGNATLDQNGRATVKLPEYFEALNKDFRYQLTAIGAPGPNLYVAEGVKENRFRIAGGRPYATVSWQVTGVRHDAYANEHRIKVEEDKPASKQKRGAADLVAHR